MWAMIMMLPAFIIFNIFEYRPDPIIVYFCLLTFEIFMYIIIWVKGWK